MRKLDSIRYSSGQITPQKEMLGHSDIWMTRHYQKIEPEVLKEAVEKSEIEV